MSFRLDVLHEWRAEEDCAHTKLGLEDTLCRIELEIELGRGNLCEVRVGERVIADVVPIRIDGAQNARLERRVGAENEERRLGIFLAQDPQDFRRELARRAVVERQGDQFLGAVPPTGDGHRARQLGHRLIDDEIVLLIVLDRPPAAAYAIGRLQDLSFALVDDPPARLDVLEPADGVLVRHTGTSENLPHGRVLRAKPPQSDPSGRHGKRCADLIEGSNAIEHPNGMQMLVPVLVCECRIEEFWIEPDLGPGLPRQVPCGRDRQPPAGASFVPFHSI